MSIDVALTDLAKAIGERGSLAYLVTVGEHGPRVVSVSVEVADDVTLVMAAGRHTLTNAAARPEVALLWPAGSTDPTHTLLVDGTAAPGREDGELAVTPTKAILHRVRAGKGAPPSDAPRP